MTTSFGNLENSLRKRIADLEKEIDSLNGKILIMGQIQQDQSMGDRSKVQEYLDEIESLKENLDRKEYLL